VVGVPCVCVRVAVLLQIFTLCACVVGVRAGGRQEGKAHSGRGGAIVAACQTPSQARKISWRPALCRLLWVTNDATSCNARGGKDRGERTSNLLVQAHSSSISVLACLSGWLSSAQEGVKPPAVGRSEETGEEEKGLRMNVCLGSVGGRGAILKNMEHGCSTNGPAGFENSNPTSLHHQLGGEERLVVFAAGGTFWRGGHAT